MRINQSLNWGIRILFYFQRTVDSMALNNPDRLVHTAVIKYNTER